MMRSSVTLTRLLELTFHALFRFGLLCLLPCFFYTVLVLEILWLLCAAARHQECPEHVSNALSTPGK